LETAKEVSPTKKKLIRVKGLSTNRSMYGFSSINFAFVAAPREGVRNQAGDHCSCREQLAKLAWYSFNNKQGSYDTSPTRPVDFETLRLLFVHSPADATVFKSKLFKGKVALNLMEDVAGWKRSTITTVVHSSYSNAWMLTGPGEWMSQPQLLSLMTWIMRLSGSVNLDTTSYDALEASLYSVKNGFASPDTKAYLPKFWDTMYIILKYNKEIFGNISLKKAWPGDLPEADEASFGIYSGLLSFVSGDSYYSTDVKQAYDRYLNLRKKYLPRENPILRAKTSK